MKKIISLFLSLTMLLSLTAGLDFSAYADTLTTGKCGENVTYYFDSKTGTLTISGTGDMYNYSYSNHASAFYHNNKFKTVIVEKGVTSIGNYVFYNNRSLTSITIPDGVTNIGGNAFYYCTSLKSITIPDSVTNIGGSAFKECTSLKSIAIPDGVTSIKNGTFYGCTSLKSVTIPNSITSIGENSFGECNSLTSITIPDGVTSIEYRTFYSCTNLTNVTIPDSVTSIGFEAFYGCTSLTSVTIPDGVTSIKDEAFYGCASLTSITIPDGVTSIKNRTFYGCTNLINVAIPDSVTSIETEAFYGCASLTSVTIPDGVTSIKDEAFYGCASLESITIPNGLTNISDFAFCYCTNLKSVIIPNSITSIGDDSFGECNSLTSITIPDGVTSIGKYAFTGCTNLESINIPDSVMSIGVGAFYDCASLASINVEENNINYSSFNGVLFNRNKNELICYPAGKNGTVYEIPDSVTSIGKNSFGYCTNLKAVVIKQDDISIESSAFYCNTLLLCKSSTKLKDREGFESQEIKYFDDISIVNDFSKFNNKTKGLYGDEGWNNNNVIYCFMANESRTYYSNSNIVFDEDFNLVKSKKIDRINDSTSRNQSESEGYSFELIKGKKYYFINGIVIKDLLYCGDEKQYVGFDYKNYCSLKAIYPDDKSVDFNYSTYKEYLEQTQKIQFCGKIISFDLNNPVSFDSFEVLNSECIDSVFLTALKKFDQKTLDKYHVIYRLHLTDGTVYDVKNYTMQCLAGETTPDGNSYSSWYCFTSDGKKISIEFEYDNNCPDNLVVYIDDCGKDPYYKLNPSTVVNVNEHVHNWINGTIIKQATCTDDGEKCYTCSICNETKTEAVKATGHTYKQTVTPAAIGKDGKIVKKCSACGATVTSSIAKISSVSLSAVNYTYNGGVKTPSVTVKDSKGKTLTNGRDYTVTYPSGRKNVGRYSVKITFKGNYSGTKTLTYNINPKGTSMSKLTAAQKGFKATWKKQSSQTTGYELQYSTSSNFKKGTKTVNISKNKTTSKSVGKLSAKKKYYVRVRTYKTVKFGGKNVKLYSGWSKAKAVTTKK